MKVERIKEISVIIILSVILIINIFTIHNLTTENNLLKSKLFKYNINSNPLWTNATGEWNQYIVIREDVFYKNGQRIDLDCNVENEVWNVEDVLEMYLCGVLK